MIIYKAGFSVSWPKHIKKVLTRHFCKYFITETIILRIMTTCTSCKTLYNVLSHTHITIGGLRRFAFFSRGMVYVGGGRLILEREVHVGGGEKVVLVGERFMLESRSSRRVNYKRESPDFGSSGWHLWLCK